MKLRYLAFMILVLVVLALPLVSPAFAQSENEPTGFRNVGLWVYPEYDDPRLLVMLEGEITGAEAPVRVRFLVPTGAEMYSAGSMDAQGRYSGGPPDRKPSDMTGWDEISYELTSKTFRVEYYADIIAGFPDKTISYDFRTPYPISNLRAMVLQPKKASNFSVTPRGSTDSTQEGFTIYLYSFNDVKTDTPLHFDITYTRSETRPSLTPDDSSVTGITIGLIIGAIVAGGLIVWFLKTRQAVPVQGNRSQRRRTARQRGSANRFCPQCGEPVDTSDKFCPSCGNRLRGSA